MTHHYEFSFSCSPRIKLTCHLFGNVQFRQEKTDCMCCTDLTWLVCCRLKQNVGYQVLVHQGFTNYLKNANGNFKKKKHCLATPCYFSIRILLYLLGLSAHRYELELNGTWGRTGNNKNHYLSKSWWYNFS